MKIRVATEADLEYRRKGIGKAIMAWLAELAFKSGCAKISWSVLKWNEPSIAFYKSLGAKPSEKWQPYQINGEALLKLHF